MSTANANNDTIDFRQGTGITLATSTDIVTITNSSPNIVQGVFKQIQDASGTVRLTATASDNKLEFKGTGLAIAMDATAGVNSVPQIAFSISSSAVSESQLNISNAGTNGQFLQKQSGDTGGMTWSADGSSLTNLVVGIGTTSFASERTITNSTYGNNKWDEDSSSTTYNYIARIYNLPAGSWSIRADMEALYTGTATTRWAARIIGDANAMAQIHPQSTYDSDGYAYNNAGNGNYDAGAHDWRYIACAGPQDGTINSGYSPWRYMGYSYYAPFSIAGTVLTTQAGDIWVQVKDFYTTYSKTFKVRNVQLIATRIDD